jgi:hypothetical protein
MSPEANDEPAATPVKEGEAGDPPPGAEAITPPASTAPTGDVSAETTAVTAAAAKNTRLPSPVAAGPNPPPSLPLLPPSPDVLTSDKALSLDSSTPVHDIGASPEAAAAVFCGVKSSSDILTPAAADDTVSTSFCTAAAAAPNNDPKQQQQQHRDVINSSSGSAGNKKRAREAPKKDSDGFCDQYLAQYGLAIAVAVPEDAVRGPRKVSSNSNSSKSNAAAAPPGGSPQRVLECRFCRAFGREAAPGRIRAVSRKVHTYKAPFKAYSFASHLGICHPDKWKAYQALETTTVEARESFFSSLTAASHSVPSQPHPQPQPLLAIANAAVAAAESRDHEAALLYSTSSTASPLEAAAMTTEASGGVDASRGVPLTVSSNGLPALNSNTKDARLGAKRLKFLSNALAAVASSSSADGTAAGTTPASLPVSSSSFPAAHRPQASGSSSCSKIKQAAALLPVRTIRFQRGNRTLDLMHMVRNNPNDTMRSLVRQAKQDDVMNVFDATRNHSKNKSRNHPPKHLFYTIDGVGSFAESIFLKAPIHGVFLLSNANPMVVELEYRVAKESSSEEDDEDEEEEEEGEDEDEDEKGARTTTDEVYEQQVAVTAAAASAAAVANLAAAVVGVSHPQGFHPHHHIPQQQQQRAHYLLHQQEAAAAAAVQQQQAAIAAAQQQQQVVAAAAVAQQQQQQQPPQQQRYAAYPSQFTRAGFWMH